MLILEDVLQEIIDDKDNNDNLSYFFNSGGTFLINAPQESRKSIENFADGKNVCVVKKLNFLTAFEAKNLYKQDLSEIREWLEEELDALWFGKGNNCRAFILEDFVDWEWYAKEIRARGWVCPIIVINSFDKKELQKKYEFWDNSYIKESVFNDYPIGRYSGSEGFWFIDIEYSSKKVFFSMAEVYNLKESIEGELNSCPEDILQEILDFIRFKKCNK